MGRESVANNPSVNITQIKKGSVINGNMKSKHSIRVDGNITGDLISDEKIIIGIHGEIGGNLSGIDITIEGYVMGDVHSRGTLHVCQNAEIAGQIFAKQIAIDKGAQLNGKISVGNGVDIPEVGSEERPEASREMPMEPTTEEQKVAGDNYGTVAW